MDRRFMLTGTLGLALLLALYLTGVHLAGGTVACPVTRVINCQTVLTGPGSVVWGVPLTGWGALWALTGLIRTGRSMPRGFLVAWVLVGISGLGWAWGHELSDHFLCLWCTGLQLLMVVSIGASIAWRDGGRRFMRGLRPLMPHWRGACLAGILSIGVSVGRQVLLGTDRWVWVASVSVLWGLAVTGVAALILSRRVKHQFVMTASVVPATVAATAISTVCVGGLCSVGAGALAPLAAVGLSGLLSASSLPFLPMVFQAVLAGIGISVVSSLVLYRGGRQRVR